MAVANQPRLFRELVLSTVTGQAGIEVVGEAENEQDVPSLVEATKSDFLFIALEESRRRPPLCDLLLRGLSSALMWRIHGKQYAWMAH